MPPLPHALSKSRVDSLGVLFAEMGKRRQRPDDSAQLLVSPSWGGEGLALPPTPGANHMDCGSTSLFLIWLLRLFKNLVDNDLTGNIVILEIT